MVRAIAKKLKCSRGRAAYQGQDLPMISPRIVKVPAGRYVVRPGRAPLDDIFWQCRGSPSLCCLLLVRADYIGPRSQAQRAREIAKADTGAVAVYGAPGAGAPGPTAAGPGGGKPQRARTASWEPRISSVRIDLKSSKPLRVRVRMRALLRTRVPVASVRVRWPYPVQGAEELPPDRCRRCGKFDSIFPDNATAY